MTEKNYNPQQKEKKAMKKQEVTHKTEKHEAIKKETHTEVVEKEETEISEAKTAEVKEAEKKETPTSKKKEKPRRTKAIINASDIPISTKHSAAICRFIKRKKIPEAIRDLELVARIKKPVPMKGEIPHRKGRMMSGRFPEKAAREFIILLKSLSSNSYYNCLENPIIV